MSLAKRDYTKRRSRHPLRSERLTMQSRVYRWRRNTLKTTVVILFIVTAYYLFFSPTLRVKEIIMPQTEYIDSSRLQKSVDAYLQSLRQLPVDKKNFFIFSKKHLGEFLQENYLIYDIVIEKKWQNSVRVSFKEEISLVTLAYPESDEWEVVNHQGIVVKKLFPFDYDPRLSLVWVEDTRDEDFRNEISMILTIEQQISSYDDLFIIDQYTIHSNEIIADTDKHFTINLPRMGDPTIIFARLTAILNQLRAENILPEEYIHLQFGDQRAFYK